MSDLHGQFLFVDVCVCHCVFLIEGIVITTYLCSLADSSNVVVHLTEGPFFLHHYC